VTVASPFAFLSQPARRALAAAGIGSREQLESMSARELLSLHGFGPKSIRMLHDAGYRFRAE
jgi:hypothetical protein